MSKRTNLNALLFMLVFLLAMVGTTFAEPLIPFQVGQRYEFNKWDSADPVNEWAVHGEVKSQVTIDSVNYFYVQQWNYDNDSAFDVLFLRSTEDALYRYNPSGPDDYVEFKKAPVGTKWSFYQEGHGFYYTVIEIVAIEPVTVPYGTFTAYKHRKYQCEFPDGSGNKSPDWYEWIVPGVATVKSVDYWGDNPPLTMELVRVTSVPEAGLDIDAIFMTSCKGPEDGITDGDPWVFELWVNLEDPGSLHHIDVTLPAGGLPPFSIYEDPDCGWEYDSSPTDYPSLSALRGDYPTGTYTLDFRDSSGELLNSVTLDYSSLPGEPLSHVDFTYPEYDGQTGIPTDPTFTWTVDPGAGDALAMWLSDGVTDELIYENVPVSTTTNSWSPGSLQPNHYYDLAVSVFNAKDLGIGPALPIMTVGGDAFEYCLMIEYLNEINFTTIPALGDFCGEGSDQPDGYVDYWDLLYFAQRWRTDPGDTNWDPRCDLDKEDNYVDVWDLMVFEDHWHEGVKL